MSSTDSLDPFLARSATITDTRSGTEVSGIADGIYRIDTPDACP